MYSTAVDVKMNNSAAMFTLLRQIAIDERFGPYLSASVLAATVVMLFAQARHIFSKQTSSEIIEVHCNEVHEFVDTVPNDRIKHCFPKRE